MRVVLSPAKVRADRFVRAQGVSLDLDWLGLLSTLGIQGQREEVEKIHHLNIKFGSHIGIARGGITGRRTVFVVTNTDYSNNISWILKNDPTFPERVVEAYRVDLIEWDASVAEEKGTVDREALALMQR